ncbi:MAG: putative processing chain [Bacteroidetes bacterium]|nr:putative processing chain [Bacteroidota bacterium]
MAPSPHESSPRPPEPQNALLRDPSARSPELQDVILHDPSVRSPEHAKWHKPGTQEFLDPQSVFRIRTFRPGDASFPPGAAGWREWCEGEGLFKDAAPLMYAGDPALLFRPTLGLVCSAHCPGTILLETYRFIRNIPADGPTIIGGFHSPMERNCLETLLVHHVPLVWCPGRRLNSRSVPREWRDALAGHRLLLLSPFTDKQRRVDRALARLRNVFVCALAETLFVPHARPGGAVASLVRLAVEKGKQVITLADPENAEIVRQGAVSVEVGELIGKYKKRGL